MIVKEGENPPRWPVVDPEGIVAGTATHLECAENVLDVDGEEIVPTLPSSTSWLPSSVLVTVNLSLEMFEPRTSTPSLLTASKNRPPVEVNMIGVGVAPTTLFGVTMKDAPKGLSVLSTSSRCRRTPLR